MWNTQVWHKCPDTMSCVWDLPPSFPLRCPVEGAFTVTQAQTLSYASRSL
jgi:hypothetical protein